MPLTQNQVDALVDFVLGIGARRLPAVDAAAGAERAHARSVPDELRKWTKVSQNGHVLELPELVRRRNAEAELFVRADAPPAPRGPRRLAVDGLPSTTPSPGLVAPLSSRRR